MNQNPTASTSAEGIAQVLSSLSPAATNMFAPVADKQWAGANPGRLASVTTSTTHASATV